MTRFGLQLWSQQTDWPGFRDAAVAADADAGMRSGFRDKGSPDGHLQCRGNSPTGGLERAHGRRRADLEDAPRTAGRGQHLPEPRAGRQDRYSRLTTSDGWAMLGIGADWFEREHDAYGIPFGASVGERLDRLDESVMLLRRLLDGERFSHEGRFYTLHDALCAPRPIEGLTCDLLHRGPGQRDAPDRGAAGMCRETMAGRSRRPGPGSRSSPSTARLPTSGVTWRRSRRP